VRSDVGELLQLPVRPFEFRRVARLFLLGLLPPADVANEEGQHGAPSSRLMVMAIFGVEGVAVGADRRDFNPPAKQRAFAGVQVTVDAILLAGALGRREQHVGGLGAQYLFPRMAKVCSAALLNSVMIPSWLIVMIGSREDSRIACFLARTSVKAARRRLGSSASRWRITQTGGPAALARLDAEHRRLHVDELAGAHLRSRLRPSQRPSC